MSKQQLILFWWRVNNQASKIWEGYSLFWNLSTSSLNSVKHLMAIMKWTQASIQIWLLQRCCVYFSKGWNYRRDSWILRKRQADLTHLNLHCCLQSIWSSKLIMPREKHLKDPHCNNQSIKRMRKRLFRTDRRGVSHPLQATLPEVTKSLLNNNLKLRCFSKEIKIQTLITSKKCTKITKRDSIKYSSIIVYMENPSTLTNSRVLNI